MIPLGGIFNFARAEEEEVKNYSRQLVVSGNKLVYEDTGEMAVLRGANIPSLGWGNDERTIESTIESFDAWNNNIIRLNIHPTYWYSDVSGKLNHIKYREIVDDIVKMAMARGKYVILDCHQYKGIIDSTVELWKDLSELYGNNPAVLFGLLNEPHSIGWKVWYGGDESQGYTGHQELVEIIRDTGAKNILVAGGLDWAYDLRGISGVTEKDEDGNEHVVQYMLTDQGSNGDTSKSGYGIMYDTHIYPMKADGKPSDWDTKVGAVRKIAPVLVGEWGWDSGNSTVMGNNKSSYDIWMNQLMQWMDDESGEYGGVPVNWTAFCMHASSSPQMIKDDVFTPTSYCGQYIKDRLLSYDSTAVLRDEIYTADFSEDIFTDYERSKASSEISDGKLNVNYLSGTHYIKMTIPVYWDMNGMQSLSFDIDGAKGMTFDIGFYCTDKEIWTKNVEIDDDSSNVTINVNELLRQGNAKTDGLLKGIEAIYISGTAEDSEEYSIDNIKITKTEKQVNTAKECPYIPSGTGLVIDMDSSDTRFEKMTSYVSPSSNTSLYYTPEYAEAEGIDNSTALKVNYNTVGASSGISTLYLKDGMNASDAKYLSVCVKGSGTSQEIVITPEGTSGVSVVTEEGDTEWRQYIFDISEWEDLGDVKTIKLNSKEKKQDYYYIDNINFSIDYPEKICAFKDSSVSYGFELTTETINPKFSIIDSNSAETIFGRTALGGYNSDYGYYINYTRVSKQPAKVVINCSDSYSQLTSKTALTNYVSFYAKSTSGKEERINLSLTDIMDNVFTEDITFTLTSNWKEYTVPIRDMPLIVSGNPDLPERIRGFRFSSATKSGSGGFAIDNIALLANEIEDSDLCTVKFETNGGERIISQRIRYGDTVVTPDIPERDNYTFGGWYSDKDLKNPWDFTNEVSEDMTLYAKWIFTGADFEMLLSQSGVIEGNNTVTAKINNRTDSEYKYTLIAAVYDKSTGKMLSMNSETETAYANSLNEWSVTVDVPQSNAFIKAFIWEGGIDEQKPVCETAVFN